MPTGRSQHRFSRHARNKVRWISRDAAGITQSAILAVLSDATHAGYDQRGNERFAVDVDDVHLTVVVDTDDDLIITVWRN